MCKFVSVIIPTYKRPVMLKRAINSVLNQSYKNIELIIVDDNNEGDEFRDEMIEFMKQYSDIENIIYIMHKYNQNGSAARNTGIERARGEYVAFLDDDDQFFSTKIEEQVNFLEKNIEYAGVCSGYIKRYKGRTYKLASFELESKGTYTASLLLGINDFATGSTLLLRKSVFREIGVFDVNLKRHQDWEFLIRFFRKYRLGVLSNILVAINSEGIRNYPDADLLYSVNDYFFNKFHKDIIKLDTSQQQKILKRHWFEVSLLYCKQKKFRRAFEVLDQKIYFQNKLFLLFELINVFPYFINSFFPFLKNWYIFFIANTKLKKFNSVE